MNALKKVGIGIAVLFLVIWITSMFLPNSYHIERSLVINTSADVIFEEVNDLKKWPNWSPWEEKDPNMKKTWGEKTAGVGGSNEWESELEGDGTMIIVESEPNTHIKTKLEFLDWGSIAFGTWTFVEEDGNTNVTWAMDGDAEDIMSKYMALMFDGMLGPDFEAGLAKLKEFCESKPAKSAYNCEYLEIPGMLAITLKDTTTSAELSQAMGNMLPKTYNYALSLEVEEIGHPFTIFHTMDENMLIIESGVAISDEIEVSPEFMLRKIPSCYVVSTIHEGPYNKLLEAHEAIKNYIADNGHEQSGPCWETYLNDPGEITDSTLWRTEVVYSVR
ncbi:MAG: SRPBCC family protein [Bacteroidia bacterium]|nr:SRPBCC family protein [Bacteroidia bacterium]